MDASDGQKPQSIEQTHDNYRLMYEQLRKKCEMLEHQLELQKIKTKKLMNNKIKGKVCPKCLKEQDEGKKNNHPVIKQDLKDFSNKIGEILKKNNQRPANSKKKQIEQIGIMNSLDLQSYESNLNKNKSIVSQFPMVQNFSIFGVSEDNIEKNCNNSGNELFQGELLYSYNEPSNVDRQAGGLVFPSGVALKKFLGQRARDKAIEIMSFSYANVKSFVLRCTTQDTLNEQQFDKNEFLCHVNPSKSLFCLCIGIYDYTSIADQHNFRKTKDPASLKLVGEDTQPHVAEDPKLVGSLNQNFRQISAESIPSVKQSQPCEIYISQRVFCISSYFPFFSFYEQILRSLMNIVKMERLMIYKHNSEDIAQTDSKFQLTRMQSLFVASMRDLNNKYVNFNRTYELKLVNLQKITLLTDWNIAKNYFIEEWVFSLMNLFTLETFIDVFTLIMLEDRVVFVCNNSHILTYMIHLFTDILTRPFVYGFQVISIVPEEDYLGAPFPIVCGMLRKRKYVEQNNIMRDYHNTYVFVSPAGIEIVYTENKKNFLKCRPAKLKNDLTNTFKQLKKQRGGNQKPTKYELDTNDYVLTASMEQKEIAVEIVEKVNEFILQEVVKKMPNHYEIKNLRNSIDMSSLPAEKEENSVLMEKVKAIVRKNIKDPFVEKLLDTQMLSNSVCK